MKQICLSALAGALALLCLESGFGQSWEFTEGPWRADGKNIVAGRASGASNATVYTHDGTTIRRSTDGGASWQSTGALSGDPLALTCKPDAPATVFAGLTDRAFRSTDGGVSWGTFVVNWVSSSDLDTMTMAVAPALPQIVLIGTEKACGNSSLLISYDNGILNTWNLIDYFTGAVATDILAIAPHPTDYQLMWVGGRTPSPPCLTETYTLPYTNGVFFSTDAGGNWANTGALNKDVVALAAYTSSGTTYVLAATSDPNNKLYRTTQPTSTSASWSSLSWSYGVITDLKVAGTTLYASATDGIYKSTNNGTSWTSLCNGLYDKSNIRRLAIDPQNSNILFASSPTTIYKSTDAGATWRDAATGITPMATSAVAANGATVLALSPSYSVVQRNTGTGWYGVDLACAQNFRGVSGDFRYLSTSHVFAAGFRQGSGNNTTASLWRSTNAGASWSEVRSGTYTPGRFNGIVTDPVNTNRIYVFGLRQNGVANSNDNVSVSNSGGAVNTWERVSIPNNTASSISAVSDLAIDPTNAGTYSDILYAAIYDGSDKGVWKSTNRGVNWTKLTHSLVNNKAIRSLGLNHNAPEVIYAAGGSSGSWWMGKSTNGGTTWLTIAGMTEEVTRILPHPSYPNSANHLWVLAAGGQKVYKTTDGGTTWAEINTANIPKPVSDLRRDHSDNALVYIATTGGIYKINAAPEIVTGVQSAPSGGHPGISWSASPESDLAASPYGVYRYYRYCATYFPHKQCSGPVENTLLAQTSVTSYIDSDWNFTTGPNLDDMRIAGYYVTAVDNGGNESTPSATVEFTVGVPYGCCMKQKEEPLLLPAEFVLEANYPNPFNPSTIIQYALPDDGHVTLKVLDVLGREIATLVNEPQAAGYKSVQYDASGLASGVYFYRLSAGSFTDVKKMIVTK